MLDLENVYCYLDDIIIIGNDSYAEHLKQVNEVVERLKSMGMKINPGESFWAQPEVEYLDYLINREGIHPQHKIIQGMIYLPALCNQKELCSFIEMVNFYKNMWAKHSSLTPFTSMIGKATKSNWLPAHQLAFDQMKAIMTKETLLAFTDFTKSFTLHINASNK